MSKYLFISFLSLSLLATLNSCSDNKKEVEKPEVRAVGAEKSYVLNGKTSSVKFTAYKTTAKVGVGGEFKTISITNSTPSPNAIKAFENAEFSIPISSLFTKDVSRDSKIKEFFFGKTLIPDFIKGAVIKVSDKKLFANLILNGISTTQEFNIAVDGQKVTITGIMDLKKWKLEKALASLNKVCYDLHKGTDGISKTWDEVALEGIFYLEVN